MDKRPIGILDSGVGGLTIWQEIQTLLPHESTVYIGDSLNAPYGDRNPEEIFQLARKLIHFLLQKNAKLIVIACNVITTTSLDRLRNEFKDVPIVGTVPVVKLAAATTKKGTIGILSTNGTANSHYQQHLIEQFASHVQVVNVGTSLLVPLVEKGQLRGGEVEKTVKKVVEPFQQARVDVIALGCTHFPFLRPVVQKVLGDQVLLLDSGLAIARQVQRILQKNNTIKSEGESIHRIHTTGDKEMVSFLLQTTGMPSVAVERVVLV